MFDNIISMGCACGTALSMKKYGMRSSAGPFDWHVSNFVSLMHFMEVDFSEFLDRKNIRITDRPNEFYDEKYDCYFANDVSFDFNDEWQMIYDRYQRRIERFLEMVKSPTCFIRCIRDESERQYIQENEGYILSVIKKYNNFNEIIFLGEKNIDSDFPFQYFPLELKNNDDDYGLIIGRNILFDGNYRILDFLCKEMKAEKIVKNLFFSNGELSKRELGIKCRYSLAVKLLNCKEETLRKLPKDIVIYGCGVIGKAFFEKCRSYCNVECFVDHRPKAGGYEGVKIIHYTDIGSIKGKYFIVTPIYDIGRITEIIFKYKTDAKVIPLDEILD